MFNSNIQFESSVIPYGSKTPASARVPEVSFESSVIPYGSKTLGKQVKAKTVFKREDHFNQAIQYLLDARRCYIVGVRASAALANFLGFYFNLMFDNVKVINSNSSTEIFENLKRINSSDVR